MSFFTQIMSGNPVEIDLRIGSEAMLKTPEEDLRQDLLQRLVAQSLLGILVFVIINF